MLQLLYYYKTTLTVFVLIYLLPVIAFIYAVKHRQVLSKINYAAWLVGTFYGGMTLWSLYWLLFSGEASASRCWDGGHLIC